jgi:hypothetical protein
MFVDDRPVGPSVWGNFSIRIPPAVGVAMATPPVLALLAGARLAGAQLTAIDGASANVFRGDRLPILPFPDTAE